MKTDTLWLVAFLLGFLFSFAVLNVTPGIGLFLGINTLVVALWYFGKKNKEAKELESTKQSTMLLNLLTGFYVLLTVPYLYRLDYGVIAILIMVHIAFLVIGALYFALPGMLHIVDILSLIISPIAFGLTWLVESVKAVFELFKENANIVKLLLKVILYATASLLVFILFAKLLSAADPEFKVRIDKILESLDLIIVMRRTVIAVVMSFVSAGLLSIIGVGRVLPLFGVSVEHAKKLWDKAFSVVFSKRSDAILPIIITTPVLFLFALYVWVQFAYLFGQDLSVILSKYTFADYARRGFVELLVVGALTYPLLSWAMNQSKSVWKVPRIATFVINTSIVSLLTIMLYSLVMRMNLYMQTYGPSVLRYYVIIGAVFVGIALLSYEILSVAKAIKPGYAIFKARIMNDYVIVALFTVLGLLGAVSLYPWNNLVARQIVTYYDSTGKLDVFQIVKLPLEAEHLVFQLGKTLEADGTREAGLLLQAHAVKEVAAYEKSRDESIFSTVFGINFAGYTLHRELPVKQEAELTKRFTTAMSERVDFIVGGFAEALEQNNFTLARSFYDPEMKSNDIAGFAPGVSVLRKVEDKLSKEQGYMETFLTGGSTTYTSTPFFLFRGTAKTEESTLSSNIGFRNGKVVMLDNTLILAYLPDAVSESGDRYEISNYGYRTFCKVPTLDVIYSEAQGCTTGVIDGRETKPIANEIYYSPMAAFEKSDFVTQIQ